MALRSKSSFKTTDQFLKELDSAAMVRPKCLQVESNTIFLVEEATKLTLGQGSNYSLGAKVLKLKRYFGSISKDPGDLILSISLQ